jgi:hypothetical protein
VAITRADIKRLLSIGDSNNRSKKLSFGSSSSTNNKSSINNKVTRLLDDKINSTSTHSSELALREISGIDVLSIVYRLIQNIKALLFGGFSGLSFPSLTQARAL